MYLRHTLLVLLRPLREFLFILFFLLSLLLSAAFTTGHTLVLLYTIIRITLSLAIYFILSLTSRLYLSAHALVLQCFTSIFAPLTNNQQRGQILKSSLAMCSSWSAWRAIAEEIDNLTSRVEWKQSSSPELYDAVQLQEFSQKLWDSRLHENVRVLAFQMQRIFSRKSCYFSNPALYSHCCVGTKYELEAFISNIVEYLHFICKSPVNDWSWKDKLRFFQRIRKSYGRSALCLSGGGAHAMFHVGVVKALLSANALPNIVNGTSGGSIIAGMLAIYTDQEIREQDLLNSRIQFRYGEHNRWLPTLYSQFWRFLKHGVLVNHEEFIRTAKAYYSEYTFEQAYRKTQREVCITVTHSFHNNKSSQPLVLNHVTSPNVLIWSAVTASCALPGLMEPQKLWCRDHTGIVSEYHHSNETVVDGSLHADIPISRLSELFNAQFFIVCQVNPHVTPFLRDRTIESDPSTPVFLKLLTHYESSIQEDILHRLNRLVKARVIPKLYRQDFTGIINAQKYSGDLTIIPKVSFLMRFKILSNPTQTDMLEYIQQGQNATFPNITRIQHSLIWERTLEACVRYISKKMRRQEPGHTVDNTHTSQHTSTNSTSNNPCVPQSHHRLQNTVATNTTPIAVTRAYRSPSHPALLSQSISTLSVPASSPALPGPTILQTTPPRTPHTPMHTPTDLSRANSFHGELKEDLITSELAHADDSMYIMNEI